MWELVKTIAIGGLTNVGFVSNSNFVVVVSHNGIGIFDCLSGERIARDYDKYEELFDDKTGEVKGIGVLQGRKIQTHGLFGNDNLPKETNDGWGLERIENNQINEVILVSPDKKQKKVIGSDEVVEIKAFGFSENEKFFVFAESSDVTIYRRKSD